MKCQAIWLCKMDEPGKEDDDEDAPPVAPIPPMPKARPPVFSPEKAKAPEAPAQPFPKKTLKAPGMSMTTQNGVQW